MVHRIRKTIGKLTAATRSPIAAVPRSTCQPLVSLMGRRRMADMPLGGGTADFLLIAARPRVTIGSERGLATELTMKYCRASQIAL